MTIFRVQVRVTGDRCSISATFSCYQTENQTKENLSVWSSWCHERHYDIFFYASNQDISRRMLIIKMCTFFIRWAWPGGSAPVISEITRARIRYQPPPAPRISTLGADIHLFSLGMPIMSFTWSCVERSPAINCKRSHLQLIEVQIYKWISISALTN